MNDTDPIKILEAIAGGPVRLVDDDPEISRRKDALAHQIADFLEGSDLAWSLDNRGKIQALLAVALKLAKDESRGETWDDLSAIVKAEIGPAIGHFPE